MADIFLVSLVLSAVRNGTWQTFFWFLWFCLSSEVGHGRHFSGFFGFVCRQKWDMADIFLVSLVLSAGKSETRQTFFWFLWFCLPAEVGHGRHFSGFFGFVCRLKWVMADIFLFSLVLSAAKGKAVRKRPLILTRLLLWSIPQRKDP